MKFDGKSSLVFTDQSLCDPSSSPSNETKASLDNYQRHFRNESSTSSQSANQSNIEIKEFDIKQYKPNSSLPYIFLNITATLNNNQVLILITQIFERIHYKKVCSIKETLQERVCVYEYKETNCFKNIFSKKCKKKSKFHVNIILDNSNNPNDSYERRIIIRSINGEEKEMVKKIIQFIKHLCYSITKIKIIKQSKIFISYNLAKYIELLMHDKKRLLYKNKNIPMNKDYIINFNNNKNLSKGYNEVASTESSVIAETNNEAGKILDIYKILSREEYSLGQSISTFITKFKEDYHDIHSTLLKYQTRDIMKKVVMEIDDCVKTFNTSFNSSEFKGEDNVHGSYVRQASEQFIFNKIYFLLFEIYKTKNNEDNMQFLAKKKEIQSKLTIDDIFKHLEIKKKFRGDDKIPFKVSIDLINKIEFEQSPKKKFENIIQANLEMRNCILGFSQGKNELDSMDDELPLTMYLATQINVSNFPAELNLIDDYLKCTIRDDLIQNKMLTNLQSSLMYIVKSWDDDIKG